MACGNITDIVVRETGRYLPGNIYARNFGKSPIVELTKRDVFPMGLSETISVLTYERSAPTDAEPTWNQVQVIDGTEGGACLPTPATVEIGSTSRQFALYRRALHGPQFCAEEFRSVFDLRLQLGRIADILAERTRLEWEMHNRNEYFKAVQTKVVVNDCSYPTESTTAAATYPATCATQPLAFSVLEKYYIQLLRDGAAGSALANSNGSPVLTVLASRETIGNLIRQNSDIRQDLRFAEEGAGRNATLLKAFGVRHEYGGFMFIADMFPRRFTCAGGTYTQVAPFSSTAASKGNKSVVNPAYRVAPYEETVIFDPDVYHQLVPQPIVAPHPQFRFDPIKYTGDWKILNILDETCNPDGNILRHRGILAAASMPVHPERGVAFVHKRCEPSGCVTACS